MYGTTYGYRTSLSKYMVDHMKKKYNFLIKSNYLKNKSSILDIGSNDGTFLNFFAKKGHKMDLFGIDPSSVKFKKFYDKKINLVSDYFSKNKIDKYYLNKKFNLVTSFAMFYDIEDPNSFTKDIANILKKDGIWISEFSYFPLLLKI